MLNEFFPSVGQTLAASVPPATHHFSDYLPAVNSPSSFFFKPVTSMELENEILLLPINKSHGLYCCPVRVLKSSGSVLSRPLAHIMNNSGLTGQYTSKLKHAKVTTQSICELFSKRVSCRSSRVPNQFNIIRFRSETGRNSLRYRGPVIWNFVNRLVKVPESFHSFKQILRKHVKIIDNFSFDKEATVVANKKDHFIYF